MSQELADKSCVPPSPGTKPYSKVEAAEMMKSIPEWELADDGSTLLATFAFPDFKKAIVFVNLIAGMAETEGHHPNIHVHNLKYVSLTLSTHDVGGLSENDFIIAAKVNKAVASSRDPEE